MIYEIIIDEETQVSHGDFKSKFESKIDTLSEQAPSDSNICSQISKLKKGYMGVLEVFSVEGHFVAKAFDMNPKDVAFSLLKDIYKQITSWKKDRMILAP